jgi:hypothetical protein
MQEMLQDWQRYDGIGSVLQRPGVEMAGGSWVEWFYGTYCCDRMDGCESCRWGPKLGRLGQLASDGQHATAGQG